MTCCLQGSWYVQYLLHLHFDFHSPDWVSGFCEASYVFLWKISIITCTFFHVYIAKPYKERFRSSEN